MGSDVRMSESGLFSGDAHCKVLRMICFIQLMLWCRDQVKTFCKNYDHHLAYIMPTHPDQHTYGADNLSKCSESCPEHLCCNLVFGWINL